MTPEQAEKRRRRAIASRRRILARGLTLPSTVIKAEAKQRHPAKGNAS